MTSEAVIHASHLSRTYRLGESLVHAVQDVNLTVAAGEFVGIVGVSGSGKSTLLHLLGGLDTPSSGMVCVAGQTVSHMTEHQRTLFRRNVVGIVFQSFFLVPSLTAEQNVALALTFRGTHGAQRDQLAAQALGRVGLGHRMRHKPKQLSGGEQQRVSIARAIVHRPKILLTDEPTGNLDQSTAQRLLRLLMDIRAETQCSIIMVTHDEALVAQYCDRLIRMHDGQFVNAPVESD